MNTSSLERKTITEELSGLIEGVTFHNDDSGFCVLGLKIKGQRQGTTVGGSLPSVNPGKWLVAEG
jgi:exodeoxyribonuclease V alpha subunit